MKRNSLKKAIATSMAVTMLLSTTAFATPAGTQGDQTEIAGLAQVESPTFSVVLPTAIEYSIDPYNMLDAGDNSTAGTYAGATQIAVAGGGYGIVNLSTIPVEVSVTARLDPFTAAARVKAMPKAYVETISADKDDKDVYIEMVSAKTATVGDDGVVDDTAFDYTGATPVVINEQKAGASNAKLTFLLEKAKTVSTEQDAGGAGVAAFAFQGKVNPVPTWAANDFKIVTKFNFMGQPTAVYTSKLAAGPAAALLANNLNMIAKADTTNTVAAATAPTFNGGANLVYAGVARTAVVTLGTGARAVDDFATSLPAGAIKLYNSSGTLVYTSLAGDATYVVASKTLTFVASKFTSSASLVKAASYKMEITAPNGNILKGTMQYY